jgi:hypothetical protein
VRINKWSILYLGLVLLNALFGSEIQIILDFLLNINALIAKTRAKISRSKKHKFLQKKQENKKWSSKESVFH